MSNDRDSDAVMNDATTYTLGIETSCDETGVAVVEDGRRIRSNVVASQTELHREYGGVVPEVACRAHVEAVLPVLEEACEEAGVDLWEIDQIAVTNTPGLVGSLLIGLQAAKALSIRLSKPLFGVDHVRAHLYSCAFAAADSERRSLDEYPFPQVGLVVSGGHTGLYVLHDHGSYERIGSTIDDAVGEAFDKVAAVLGLPYPGGPSIESCAQNGDPNAVEFPRPMTDSDDYRFSYSGLKTAVLYHCREVGSEDQDEPPEDQRPDIAASFQEAALDALIVKLRRALDEYDVKGVSVGGGVAANGRLREKLNKLTGERDLELYIPPLSLCTDNGAMIAGMGYRRARTGEPSRLDLDATPT